MADVIGEYGTFYKVKKEENLFWGDIWLRAFSETKWESGRTWKSGKLGARSELYQKKVKNQGDI